MLGYDYEIIFGEARENVVANALSRKYEDEGSFFSLSFIVAYWLNGVDKEWFAIPKISHVIQQLERETHTYQGYTQHSEEIHYKEYLYLN